MYTPIQSGRYANWLSTQCEHLRKMTPTESTPLKKWTATQGDPYSKWLPTENDITHGEKNLFKSICSKENLY